MSQLSTLKLPDKVDRALQEEAARTGKSTEQVAIEWIGSHIDSPPRGSVDTILSSHGAWSMVPDERARIEQMIEEERSLEENRP